MEVAVSSFLTTMSRAWVRALLTDELRVCAARRTFMIWRPNSIWDLGQLQPSTDTTQVLVLLSKLSHSCSWRCFAVAVEQLEKGRRALLAQHCLQAFPGKHAVKAVIQGGGCTNYYVLTRETVSAPLSSLSSGWLAVTWL
ncbi:uncharacterized protein LOC135369227 isoform X2 [Ornithodoros turicata]|uniref:uncharacterized protein LOC135369227 isoform X2 n=1 Tax=Ornithodoros turicata TaxID=34597 RepID=UPI003139E721